MSIRDELADILDDVQEKERRWGHVATPGMLADAVLDVFEKAHTPTDDEREALTKRFADLIFAHGLRAPYSTIAVIAFKEIAAGFRRLEVPEPSEYGVTYVDPKSPATITETLEKAQESQRFYDRIGHGKYVSTILQRTKGVAPGPWTAVTEQGENRAV